MSNETNISSGGNLAQHLFYEGKNVRAYEYLGAHRQSDGSVVFRTWAPNAKSISVVGDFNDWNPQENYMYKCNSGGVWECEIQGVGDFFLRCRRRGSEDRRGRNSREYRVGQYQQGL